MAEDFISGYFGGIAGLLIGHPFDTVKVNLQNSTLFKGPIDCFKQLIVKEKLNGLYKGISSPLLGAAFLNAILFGVNGISNSYLPDHLRQTYYGYFLSGMTAGAAQTLITCPTELIKIRMQIHDYSISAADQSRFTMTNVARDLFKNHGIRSFYRGMFATLLRDVPGFGIYFASFEYLNFLSNHMIENKSTQFHILQVLVSGGMAGVLSWIFSYYFDTIKTRIQSGQSETENASMLEVKRLIYKQDGFKGFYRGMGTALFRAFPVNAATFGVATLTEKLLYQFHVIHAI